MAVALVTTVAQVLSLASELPHAACGAKKEKKNYHSQKQNLLILSPTPYHQASILSVKY